VAAREGVVSEGAVRDAAARQGVPAGGTAPPPLTPAEGASAVTRSAEHAAQPADRPRSYYRDADGRVRRDLHPRELLEAVRSRTGALWVDIDATNRHQHALLEKVFNFHPLAIEDTLNPQSRVKLEEFPEHLFAIVRGVKFCEDTNDPYDVETFNQCFFLTRNVLVTTHGQVAPAVDAVFERVDRSPDLLERGAERLMHAVMDSSIDAYFPILDQLDEFIDGLEQRVYAAFDQEALRDIFSVKRLTLTLRRHLTPQREVFNTLTNRPSRFLSPDVQVYFRDVYDHVLRINDSLDTYRELLSSVLDSYLSQVSNRLGATSKTLALVGTMSLPFVVVSGMWGMNFSEIPLAQHANGFWIMLVVQIALGVFFVGILKLLKIL